jgi:hypothetical protein
MRLISSAYIKREIYLFWRGKGDHMVNICLPLLAHVILLVRTFVVNWRCVVIQHAFERKTSYFFFRFFHFLFVFESGKYLLPFWSQLSGLLAEFPFMLPVPFHNFHNSRFLQKGREQMTIIARNKTEKSTHPKCLNICPGFNCKYVQLTEEHRNLKREKAIYETWCYRKHERKIPKCI